MLYPKIAVLGIATMKHKIAQGKSGDSVTKIWVDISEILDALPFYVLLVDENHNILQANSKVREHLNVEPREIIGKYCPKVIHGIDGPFEGCPLEEAG